MSVSDLTQQSGQVSANAPCKTRGARMKNARSVLLRTLVCALDVAVEKRLPRRTEMVEV